jgi:hypothetical protein
LYFWNSYLSRALSHANEFALMSQYCTLGSGVNQHYSGHLIRIPVGIEARNQPAHGMTDEQVWRWNPRGA